MKPSSPYTSIGGQAVIEGVMMRSPHFAAVAVRRPDGKIIIRSQRYQGIADRFPILKKPVLRGVVTLIESMVQGIEALSYSANIAIQEAPNVDASNATPQEELTGWAIFASIALAMALGLGLFVALPHLLAAVLTSWLSGDLLNASSPLFHLIDGVFKMGILLLYVYLIGLRDDIRRVFQYHGAEHKSIYAFEAGKELTVENASAFTTLHPRCGTSFLLFLVLISVGVFSIVFPLFGLSDLTHNRILNHLVMVVIKMALMLPVAGLSYELIKACALRMDRGFFKLLIWPGLTLQRLTTRAPDADQLEVALASLRRVLFLEKQENRLSESKNDEKGAEEITIASLSEILVVPARVAEFPES